MKMLKVNKLTSLTSTIDKHRKKQTRVATD